MKLRIHVTCPYCGHTQPAMVEFADNKPYTRPEVIVCDSEEGGCDKYYVFTTSIAINVVTGTISGDIQPEQEARP